MSQLKRLQSAMSAAGVEHLQIHEPATLQWLAGFTGSFGIALVTPNEGVFITDSRYTIQARNQVKELDVVPHDPSKVIQDVVADQVKRLGAKQLAFEPSASYAQVEAWRAKYDGVELVSCKNLLTDLFKIKTADEIALIKEACKLGDACMQRAISMIQVGVSEYDIGLDIEFFFRKQGAKIGFDPIVASGPNSALPHARPSERKIERGDFVTLDLGCSLDGYCSDITRTVVVGECSDRHREIYEQVLRAEEECCAALVPGANGKDVDQLARDILNEKDLAQYFGHSLGHGLGRVVHDPGRLYHTADEPIVAGQVWTVEPGVYIEGFGGVRIEDDVVVTASGPEIITHTPKALLIV